LVDNFHIISKSILKMIRTTGYKRCLAKVEVQSIAFSQMAEVNHQPLADGENRHLCKAAKH